MMKTIKQYWKKVYACEAGRDLQLVARFRKKSTAELQEMRVSFAHRHLPKVFFGFLIAAVLVLMAVDISKKAEMIWATNLPILIWLIYDAQQRKDRALTYVLREREQQQD